MRLDTAVFGIALLCCLGFMGVQLVHGECNVCQRNQVACINETSYYPCFGTGTPNTNQVFTCADGLVCTDLPTICFQRSDRPASCDDVDTCGLCNAELVFACTSRTTFKFCFGALQPSAVNGTCPLGYVCDASTQNICVSRVTENSIVCNLN